jgi:ribosomal protein S27AE
MANRGRPRTQAVTEIHTRDPQPVTRDPQPAQRLPRRYIPANMPTLCPECGHSTRMADGRHIDPVRKTILEYRTCAHCGEKLAAGRDMTDVEADRYCQRVEAVAEYEQAVIK